MNDSNQIYRPIPALAGVMQNVLKASNEINSNFAKSIAPLFDEYRQLSEQSQSLVQLRDTLLPKLISGELRVSDLKLNIEEMLG